MKMYEVWMLDYLDGVFPYMGVFESEEAAWAYVDNQQSELPRDYFKPFKVTVNDGSQVSVPHTAPNRRYVNQR